MVIDDNVCTMITRFIKILLSTLRLCVPLLIKLLISVVVLKFITIQDVLVVLVVFVHIKLTNWLPCYIVIQILFEPEEHLFAIWIIEGTYYATVLLGSYFLFIVKIRHYFLDPKNLKIIINI